MSSRLIEGVELVVVMLEEKKEYITYGDLKEFSVVALDTLRLINLYRDSLCQYGTERVAWDRTASEGLACDQRIKKLYDLLKEGINKRQSKVAA